MKKSLILLSFLVVLTGCSHLSATHLPRNQLVPDQAEVIALDFWDFHYVARTEGDGYLVSGKALPNTRVWPGMAEWFQELVLFGYVTDAQGIVLGGDHRLYPVQRMVPEGVDFAFRIPLEAVPADTDAQVTFGYRMSLTGSQFQSVPRRGESFSSDVDVFSAQQGPLPR